MDNMKISMIFKALSDETRVEVVRYLQSGEKCACNIVDDLKIAQSKLSYHMKILCESEIVESWTVGKWTYYRISEKGSRNAINILEVLTSVKDTQSKPCS